MHQLAYKSPLPWPSLPPPPQEYHRKLKKAEKRKAAAAGGGEAGDEEELKQAMEAAEFERAKARQRRAFELLIFHPLPCFACYLQRAPALHGLGLLGWALPAFSCCAGVANCCSSCLCSRSLRLLSPIRAYALTVPAVTACPCKGL